MKNNLNFCLKKIILRENIIFSKRKKKIESDFQDANLINYLNNIQSNFLNLKDLYQEFEKFPFEIYNLDILKKLLKSENNDEKIFGLIGFKKLFFQSKYFLI